MVVVSDSNAGLLANRGLVRLYLLLIPGSFILSAAMGYDSSLMNGIQAVDRWAACESRLVSSRLPREMDDHQADSLLFQTSTTPKGRSSAS